MKNHSVYSSLITRMVSVFLALVILAGAMPQAGLAASPAQTATCSTRYTVKSGDTLSAISFTYDVSVADLAAANNLKEPYTLFVGQVLCIPGTTASPSTGTSTSSTPGITLDRDERNLFITTNKLPAKTYYYVKIRDAFRNQDVFVKIGNLRTKKLGDRVFKFQIPKAMRGNPLLQVCIRNSKTDKDICAYVSYP